MRFVFVHGSGGTSDHWRRQLAGFPDSVALDLPGHGPGSAQGGMTSVGDYTGWVVEEIRRRGLEGSILAGHSLGGGIALLLALQEPALVAGIALVGSGARLRVMPAVLEGVQAADPEVLKGFVGFAYGPTADPAEVARDSEAIARIEARVTWGDLHACDGFDVMDRVSGLRLPTLVLCGAEDALTPPKYSRFLAERIPGARLVLLEGAGHMVMVERAAEVNSALGRFRDELSGRG